MARKPVPCTKVTTLLPFSSNRPLRPGARRCAAEWALSTTSFSDEVRRPHKGQKYPWIYTSQQHIGEVIATFSLGAKKIAGRAPKFARRVIETYQIAQQCPDRFL